VLESLDRLAGGQLSGMVRRPGAPGRMTFESVDFDPATLATAVHPVDGGSFAGLASTSVGPDGHRVAVLLGNGVRASWFTPGEGAAAGWSTATPIGIVTRGPDGVRTFVLADGTALVVSWAPAAFGVFVTESLLTAMVRSPRSGWQQPVLVEENHVWGQLPRDGVVDAIGLHFVNWTFGEVGEGLVVRQWLPSERTWSPARFLILDLAIGPLQVVRSGNRAHAIWHGTGQLMAAHRR